MLEINYKAEKFGKHWGAALQGSHILKCSWADLVWAAITVGKRDFSDVIKFGNVSLNEMIYRTYILYANLNEVKNKLYRSSIYNNQDTTEKAFTSYFVGMMTSKLIAEKLFDTPWLLHLESLPGFKNGLIGISRPDLIGLTIKRKEWIIIEAKGRTNTFSRAAQNVAKKQTRQLRHISGALPILRVANQSYFNDSLHVRITDPDEYDDEAIDIDINVNSYLTHYYSNFIGMFEDVNVKNINKMEYVYKYIDELDLTLGMNLTLYYDLVTDIENTNLMEFESYVESGIHLYKDGLMIELGDKWDSNNMSKLSV